jgi:cell division protein FtsI (penicillin-binding protein 3)
VGFAPVEAPRFVMLVMLDEPRNEKWGSEAAAPIFSAIGRDILRYLDVPARDAASVAIVSPAAEEAKAAGVAGRVRLAGAATVASDGLARMPDLGARTKRQALAALAPLGVEVEMVGQGLVVSQEPPAGTPLTRDVTVRLALMSPGAAVAAPAAAPPVAALGRERGASLPPPLEISGDGDR